MKHLLGIFCIGLCILLAVWCNLNTYFIKQNTKRIENLENCLPVVNQVDTIYVVHHVLQEQKTKKK